MPECGHQRPWTAAPGRSLLLVAKVWLVSRLLSRRCPRCGGTPLRSSTSPRVLLVVTANQRRGAEVEGVSVAKALNERGLSVRSIALAPGPSGDPGIVGLQVLGDQPLGLATLRRLRQIAREFDLVVAYGSRTLPACAIALAGARCRFIYRSIGDPTAWLRGPLHRWRTRVLLRRAQSVVVLWPGARESIVVQENLDPSKVHVIPNARSSAVYRPPEDGERESARLELGFAGSRRVLATVGSLAPEKRVHLVIEALAHLPDCVLVVAGDGPLRGELQELADRTAPDRVSFLGAVREIQTVYHAADAVIMPSATEGLPGVLLEASLCGCPVVASAVGGVAWLMENGVVGELIHEPVSPQTIADAVGRLPLVTAFAPVATPCWELDGVIESWRALLLGIAGDTRPDAAGAKGRGKRG